MPSLYASAQSSTVTDFLLTTPSMCHVPHHLCVLSRAIPAPGPLPLLSLRSIQILFLLSSRPSQISRASKCMIWSSKPVPWVFDLSVPACWAFVKWIFYILLENCFFLTIIKQIGKFMLCWLFLRSPMSIPFLTCAFYPESDALGGKNHLLPMLCFLKFGILSFKSYSMLW